MSTDNLIVHQLKLEKELDLNTYYIEECHHSETPKECVNLYDQWSVTYDDVMKRVEYHGPKLLIQVCLSHLAKLINEKEKINILEIGAGSGESGRLLKAAIIDQFGRNAWNKITLDGVDGSTGMLEVAKNREERVYSNLYNEILLPDQPSAVVGKEKYDIVMGVGIFSQGHMQCEHILHFIEPAKRQGGLIIYGLCEKWFIQLGMEKKVNELEEAGVWRLIKKTVLPGYTQYGAGTYFVYGRL